jgi:isopenicillin-N N-acyltransferase-like protein
MLDLPIVECAGTPTELGHAYGSAVRAQVQDFVAQRQRAARVYLRARGHHDFVAFRTIAAACLDQLRTWHPDGWTEHHATASAAGVDPIDLYATGNMTDIRDVLVLGSMRAEDEGCSTALVPPVLTIGGDLIAGQTWDLNPSDLDFVVAVHRRPTDGPETWAITCVGCPTLMGMNAHGIAVGTTNLKTRGSRPGIPYLSLLHRALQATTRQAAEQVIASAPRAAAHTYWIAHPDGACDLECTADTCVRRELADAPLTRTNHCLVADHQVREGEPVSTSSHHRLIKMCSTLATGNHSVATISALFADRSDGIDSINRYDEDGQGTSTNACIICVPARRELRACRGSADRGRWISLPFNTVNDGCV